jgi:hypothetical protein
MGPLEGTSMERLRRPHQTNVFSVAALIKAFLPHFGRSAPGWSSTFGVEGYWQEFRRAVLGHPKVRADYRRPALAFVPRTAAGPRL